MLGLRNSLSSSSSIQGDVFIFSLDLLGANDFSSYSVEGGSISFTANQSAPDGSTGWLKGVYPETNQTDAFSGVENDEFNTPYYLDAWSDLPTPRPGSSYTVKFDIYLEDTNNWGEDDVKTYAFMAGAGVNSDVPVNTSYSFNETSVATLNTSLSSNEFRIYWPFPGDKPLGGSVFYLKNISIVIHP